MDKPFLFIKDGFKFHIDCINNFLVIYPQDVNYLKVADSPVKQIELNETDKSRTLKDLATQIMNRHYDLFSIPPWVSIN